MHTAWRRKIFPLTVIAAIADRALSGANGKIVETTPAGKTTSKTLMPNGAGDLFGLALTSGGRGLYYVNDSGSGSAANSLQSLQR